ncbi:hypothetical protein AFGD_007137 [Aspergillus flavus]|nr:hypothetical protein AFGD_007137 [Aspergillus flavus]
MDHLRDSLLSSVPRDTPSTAAIDHARRDREGTRQAVAWGEFKEVRDMAFSNRTWVVTSRYCDIGDGVDSLEGHIHSLWYMYYELGRNITPESSEHEGLVLDILRIQGMGPLTRPARGVSGIDIARTVDGTLWNDLPFMCFYVRNTPSQLCKIYDGVGKPFGRQELDQVIGQSQAICGDFPVACFGPELIKAYPEAKVILTYRDVDEWHHALSGQQSVLGDSSQSRKNARDADFLGSTDMAQDMAGLL